MSEQTKTPIGQDAEVVEIPSVMGMTWQDIRTRLETALNDGFTPGDKADLTKLVDRLEEQLSMLFNGPEMDDMCIDGDHELELHVALPTNPEYDGPVVTVSTQFAYFNEDGYEEPADGDGDVAVTPLACLMDYIGIQFSYQTGYSVGLNAEELKRCVDMEEGEDVFCLTLGEYMDMLENLFVEAQVADLLDLPAHVAASIIGCYSSVTGLCVGCSDDDEEDPCATCEREDCENCPQEPEEEPAEAEPEPEA